MTASTSFEAMDFYPEFQCIGSDCEYNCCNSWSIEIDKKTHKKYIKHDNNNGTNICDEIITTSKKTEFKLKENGNCPQLQNDGLCSIVCKIGPETLSEVCQTYPRQANYYINRKKTFLLLSLSCPEVCRKTIFRQDPLRKTTLNKTQSIEAANINPSRLNGDTHLQETTLDLITNSFIDIAQLRDIPLQKRAASLLILASIATKTDAKNTPNAAKTLLSEARKIRNEKLSKIPDLPENRLNQFSVLIELSRTILSLKAPEERIKPHKDLSELFSIALNGIEIFNVNKITEKNFELYKDSYNENTKPYFEKNQHIIENLICYHLMKGNLFYQKDSTPLDNLIMLMIYVLIISGLSAGLALSNKEITEPDLNRIIFLLHRTIEHSEGIKNVLTAQCKNLNSASIGHLYTFIA